MRLTLDHLVLGTADLSRGAAQLTKWFGVEPFGGGEHELFATHNKLWRIEAPHYPIYLELIAINPAASPKRSRWFGLDAPSFAGDEIAVIGMVARCEDIALTAREMGPDHYEILDLARGDLRWQFAVEQHGYAFPSATPNLIEWQGAHPLDHAAPQGLELQQVIWPSAMALALDWPCPVVPSEDGEFGFRLANGIGQTIQF